MGRLGFIRWIGPTSMGLALFLFLFMQVGSVGVPSGSLLTSLLLALGAYGFGATACVAALDRGRAPAWMISGIVMALVAFAALVAALAIGWPREAPQRTFARALVAIPSGWTALMAAVGLILLPRARHGVLHGVRVIGVMTAVASVGLTVFATAAEPMVQQRLSRQEFFTYQERIQRSIMIAVVGYGGSLFAVWVVARFRQLTGDLEVDVGEYTFDMTCPRCGSRQRVVTGRDVCGACGLQIRVVPA